MSSDGSINTLERAAAAVCEARCDPERPDPGKGLDEHIALAVLKAIREPDEEALLDAVDAWHGRPVMLLDDDIKAHWQFLIDHIITEGEGKTGA